MQDLYLDNLRDIVVNIGLKIVDTEEKIGADEINGGYKFRDGQSLLILDALWESSWNLYFRELIRSEA